MSEQAKTGPQPPSRRVGALGGEFLLAGVVLASGLFAAFHPMLLSRFQRLQTDAGDTRFNHYVLEHSYRWLSGDPLHSEFWNPPIFYPQKNVLAYSDTLATVAPPYWGLRALGISPIPAFGCWMILMMALTFLSGYALLRHGLRQGAIGSTFGAWLITFASPRWIQIGHQQLLPHFFTLTALHALFVLFGRELASTRTRRLWWLLFWSCVVCQFYAGYYYGFFLFLALALAAVGTLFVREMRQHGLSVVRKDWRFILSNGAIAALLISPLAWHYLAVAQDVGLRSYEKYGLPRMVSYVWMGSTNWIYGGMKDWPLFRDVPNYHGQAMGLGFVATSVLVWMLFRHRREWFVRILLFVLGSFCLFCTVLPGERTLFKIWFYSVPGIQAIRVLARIGVLFAIPAAYALARQISTPQSTRTRIAWIFLAVICCLEQAHIPLSYDTRQTQWHEEAIRSKLESAPSDLPFYVEPFPGRDPVLTQLDAMWVSLELGRPTINGYSGNVPPKYELLTPTPEETEAALDGWANQHPELRMTVLRSQGPPVIHSAARLSPNTHQL